MAIPPILTNLPKNPRNISIWTKYYFFFCSSSWLTGNVVQSLGWAEYRPLDGAHDIHIAGKRVPMCMYVHMYFLCMPSRCWKTNHYTKSCTSQEPKTHNPNPNPNSLAFKPKSDYVEKPTQGTNTPNTHTDTHRHQHKCKCEHSGRERMRSNCPLFEHFDIFQYFQCVHTSAVWTWTVTRLVWQI